MTLPRFFLPAAMRRAALLAIAAITTSAAASACEAFGTSPSSTPDSDAGIGGSDDGATVAPPDGSVDDGAAAAADAAPPPWDASACLKGEGGVIVGSTDKDAPAIEEISGRFEGFDYVYAPIATRWVFCASIYLASGQGPHPSKVHVGVYTEEEGEPAQRLSVATIDAPIIPGWNHVALNPPTLLVPPKVWIGVAPDKNTVRVRAKTTCGVSEMRANDTATMPPNPFGANISASGLCDAAFYLSE